MLEYIRAKAADYAILLNWIEQELQDIATQCPKHHPLIVRLQSATKRYGFDWIEDIVVHLNGQHATFANLLIETPLILAPPQHAISLLDMPGLYHELGHNVFDRLPKIAKVLRAAVSKHSALLHTKAGSLTPELEDKWNSAADDVLEYWRIGRLGELFCDIFATFICGPAHYVSCIDMGLRSDHDPFFVDGGDDHPPFAARVYVCYKSLNIIYANEPVVALARNAWKIGEGKWKRDESFELICSESLLDCLLDTSIRCIEELLPNAKYYSTPLPCDEELEHITEEVSLEEMLNRGAKILFTYPENYASWEEKIFKQLKAIYKPDLSM